MLTIGLQAACPEMLRVALSAFWRRLAPRDATLLTVLRKLRKFAVVLQTLLLV